MPFLLDEGCVVGEAPTPAQMDVAAQIDRIMCETGFLYVKNLGVDRAELTDVFGASQELFRSERLAPFVLEKNIGHKKFGKTIVNRARPGDLHESFCIRTRRCYENDYSGSPPGFEHMMHTLWDRLEDASRRFSIALALAMGLPTEELDFFSRTLKEMETCTLRLNHYPPCDFAPGVTDGSSLDGAIRIGEHTDFGLFTLLLLDGEAPGLQAKRAHESDDTVSGTSGCTLTDWIDAPGLGGNIAVVNSGALLARWTNDRWRATAHRVIVASAEEAAEHRYSIPFFVHPSPETLVAAHPHFAPAGEQPRYAPINAAAYLKMKLDAIHEERTCRVSQGGA
jgi:isopenicillin N synthase-like dioxygenase